MTISITQELGENGFFALGFPTLLVFLAVCSITTFGQTPEISKVEPPSWWTGHKVNPVRLLVRGRNLKGARVRSPSSVFAISNLRINEAGTY
ncbi:MAG TPA: cyclomaltodextrinase N-terminal domain-containing protein, partial [Pyrinomonadaceae bacterium]|nr:cyclomaltodextrinase N-terminal domain-containing protein [Pyrinomonadaceae bacterium]